MGDAPYRTAPIMVERELLELVRRVLRDIGAMPSNAMTPDRCTWPDAYQARREVSALLGIVTDELGREAAPGFEGK